MRKRMVFVLVVLAAVSVFTLGRLTAATVTALPNCAVSKAFGPLKSTVDFYYDGSKYGASMVFEDPQGVIRFVQVESCGLLKAVTRQ